MENILPLETIQRALEDRNATEVARRCGLSKPTVLRVANGDFNISISTWKKLSDYLNRPIGE